MLGAFPSIPFIAYVDAHSSFSVGCSCCVGAVCSVHFVSVSSYNYIIHTVLHIEVHTFHKIILTRNHAAFEVPLWLKIVSYWLGPKLLQAYSVILLAIVHYMKNFTWYY